MSAKHSPGPWVPKVRESSGSGVCTVYVTEDGWVEIVAPNGGHEDDYRAENSANARLIAASPDLLEALKAYDAWTDKTFCTEPELKAIRNQIRAAIAKATGEAP